MTPKESPRVLDTGLHAFRTAAARRAAMLVVRHGRRERLEHHP